MNNLIFGLEVTVIGVAVTMVTLFILACVLFIFTRAFAGGRAGKEKGDKPAPQRVKPAEVVTTKPRIGISPAGQTLRPEIVAAAIGAINYTLGKKAPGFPIITKILSKEAPKDFWTQANRTRLVTLRQDFVLYKRGKLR